RRAATLRVGWSCAVTSQCFFFQAEDGIRDFHVTGVQTCALPIFVTHSPVRDIRLASGRVLALITLDNGRDHTRPNTLGPATLTEIGRASCRERVESPDAAAAGHKAQRRGPAARRVAGARLCIRPE